MTYLSALLLIALSLIPAWLLDRLLGDPPQLPHPIVFFGKTISWGEKRLNRGNHRLAKGALLAIGLISATALATWGIERGLSHFSPWAIVPQTSFSYFSHLPAQRFAAKCEWYLMR